MSDFAMTIDGTDAPTEGTFGVINPATGEVFAEAPDCTPAQLDQAFAAAEKAMIDWRRDDDARRAALSEAGDKLMAAAAEIGPTLTAEQGKPINDAVGEIFGAGIWLKYYADLEISPEVIQDDANAYVEVLRRPVGPVAAITPWNYPVVLASWKIAPALRAGNTMVLKPSPYTPLSTLAFVKVLNEVLPAGVLNAVSGADPLGALMTAHPVPRKVSFTGSVSTGKKVAAAAAPDLKRITLELGGNDAAVVLDDVDVDKVANRLYEQAFQNCGQVCSAIKRVYVPESIHDEVVDVIAARARDAVVGDGADPSTQIGPINNKMQFDIVSNLVGDALSKGGRAAAGGSAMDRPGYFFEPTVITGVAEETTLVTEEQFGPALPIVAYRDVDDAVARANSTMHGLGGSVWSSDEDRAVAVAERLECGTAWVNTHLALAPHQPFSGAKWSGLGVENGPWGYYGFTELQVVHRARS